MAITFKVKRGTKAQNAAYKGQQGELTMATDTGEETIIFHDGATDGGFELGRADLKNVKIPLGGVTFEYYWNDEQGTGYPTSQSLATSSSSFSGTHYLYLDAQDKNEVYLTNFLDKIGTISASIIGHFRVYKKADATEFKIFSITDAEKFVGGGGSPIHFRFEVTQLASNLTLADNDEIVISYISAGEDAINAFVTESYIPLTSTSKGTVATADLANGLSGARVYIGATVAEFNNVDTASLLKNQYNVGTPVHSPAVKLTVTVGEETID